MSINGITNILNDRKWVFAYVCLAAVWLTDPKSIPGTVAIMFPAVLGANFLDKSQWRTHNVPKPGGDD